MLEKFLDNFPFHQREKLVKFLEDEGLYSEFEDNIYRLTKIKKSFVRELYDLCDQINNVVNRMESEIQEIEDESL